VRVQGWGGNGWGCGERAWAEEALWWIAEGEERKRGERTGLDTLASVNSFKFQPCDNTPPRTQILMISHKILEKC